MIAIKKTQKFYLYFMTEIVYMFIDISFDSIQ